MRCCGVRARGSEGPVAVAKFVTGQRGEAAATLASGGGGGYAGSGSAAAAAAAIAVTSVDHEEWETVEMEADV